VVLLQDRVVSSGAKEPSVVLFFMLLISADNSSCPQRIKRDIYIFYLLRIDILSMSILFEQFKSLVGERKKKKSWLFNFWVVDDKDDWRGIVS